MLASAESSLAPLLSLLVALPSPVLGGDLPQELRLHAWHARALPAEDGSALPATSTIVSSRTPPGVWTRTCSLGLRPSSALPTGEPVETHSGGAPAVTLVTIVYWCSPSVSRTRTLEPGTTMPFHGAVAVAVGSLTSDPLCRPAPGRRSAGGEDPVEVDPVAQRRSPSRAA
jgi:hypothetical protein